MILVVIGLRASLSKKVDGVYPIFSTAGRQWLAGETAYIPPAADLDIYRYSPPITAFFAPWTLLPERLACVLWRGFNAAIFLGGLLVWCRARRPAVDTAAMLLVIPLAVGGLNNAQCNAFDSGMLLFAAAAFVNGFWTTAAACASVPVLFKGYPLALGLLLGLVEPKRFAPRLVICLLIGAAVPFCCQRPAFVFDEYAAFFSRLAGDDRTQFEFVAGYRDLHMLLRRYGLPLSLMAYRIVEIVLGGACAAIILWGRARGWDRRTAAEACVWLGLCWMTVAGPATESCTYVLISPVLAVAVLTAKDRPRWQQSLVGASFVLFTVAAASVWFPGWFAHPIQATAIQPLGALFLSIWVLVELGRSLHASPAADHFFSTFGKSANSSRTAA
jgi:hypothetical protein